MKATLAPEAQFLAIVKAEHVSGAMKAVEDNIANVTVTSIDSTSDRSQWVTWIKCDEENGTEVFRTLVAWNCRPPFNPPFPMGTLLYFREII